MLQNTDFSYTGAFEGSATVEPHIVHKNLTVLEPAVLAASLSRQLRKLSAKGWLCYGTSQ